MNSTWNELLQFETRDLIERYVKSRHSRCLNENRILQISSNFIQAREYFRNAENSEFSVKPLLLYYGIMSLSKGLILALDVSNSEDQLKSSHGLCVKNWAVAFTQKEFEKIEITIENGTFFELLNATKNTNYLKSNSSAINWKSQLKLPQSGDVITLKQLVQYFPDLDNQYFSWTQERLNFAQVYDIKIVGDNYVIKIANKIEINELEQLFPIEFCPDKEIEIIDNLIVVTFKKDKWFPNFTQNKIPDDIIGFSCIIPALPNDIGLNLVGGMYMMSYVLGMMARYFPTTWMSLMRVEKGDRFYPFANNVLNYIEDEFPKQVLAFLKAPYDFEKKTAANK